MSNTEEQWWKKYVSDKKMLEFDMAEKKNPELPDNGHDHDRNLYELQFIAKENCPASFFNEVLEYVNATKKMYLSRETKYKRDYVIERLSENPNVKECSFDVLKEAQMNFGEFDDIVLAHKDCTEKDLIDLAKTSKVDFERFYSDDETGKPIAGHKPIIDQENLTTWGKIFMDPHASTELKEAIADRGTISQDVVDHYLQRDDCPQEFLLVAIQNTMSSYFHRYYRNTDYTVDAEKLNDIVAHPKMTERAFEEALYIVRQDMVQYAEKPTDSAYYQGEDDTCNLTRENQQKIMQTMLKNPACTPGIAVEIFIAAQKTDLLDEIRDFNQTENLFPKAEKEMEEKLAFVARQEKIENAIARIHSKSEDHLTAKQAGDAELNKIVMKEKFLDGDYMAKKKAGKTIFNKSLMKLRQKLQSDRK